GFGYARASSNPGETAAGPTSVVAGRRFTSSEILFDSEFATTRSGLPSPVKSPIATANGPDAVPKSSLGAKLPSPFPCSTETVPAPGQHRDLVRGITRDGQVVIPVAIEVADRDRLRQVSSGEIGPRHERPVAVAEQHGHRARVVVRDDDVEPPVTVQVADRHRL